MPVIVRPRVVSVLVAATIFVSSPAFAQTVPDPDPIVDLVCAPAPQQESTTRNFILSGFYSKHFSDDRLENDRDTGLFFEHDFNRRYGILIGEYKNSGNIESRIVAAQYEAFHHGHLAIGLVAGAITGYMQLNHGNLGFAGLPFVSYTAGRVKTRIFCSPPVIKTAPAMCSVQFGFDLGPAL